MDDKSDAVRAVTPREERAPDDEDQQQREPAGEQPSAKQDVASAEQENPDQREDPEEYGDPICVCEPEPYWQEIAEQLERERERKNS